MLAPQISSSRAGGGAPLPPPSLFFTEKPPHLRRLADYGAGLPLPLFPLLRPACWSAFAVSLLASFLDAVSVARKHVLPDVRSDFLAVLLG